MRSIAQRLSILGMVSLALSPSIHSAPAQGSGPTVRWEVDDGADGWIGTGIALGDHGSALIAAKVRLETELGFYSTASPHPISTYYISDAPYCAVAAASRGQALAALTTQDQSTGAKLDILPTLRVWSSARPGPPDWQYDFPLTEFHSPDGIGVHFRSDGDRVIAWVTDRSADLVAVRVFDGSGALLGQLDLPGLGGSNAYGSQGTITPDASHLLIDISGTPHLIDLSSGHVVQTWNSRSKRGGLAISANGEAVAIGDMNLVEVYRKSLAGSFTLDRSYSLQGSRFGGPLALDADATHLAYSVNWTTRTDKLQIRLQDLVTDTELWRQEVGVSGNNLPLWVRSVEIAENADTVAVASLGDDRSASPTGMVFDQQGNILSTFHTEGSVLAMDYDPIAQVVAFATKDTHQSRFGAGGDIICADAMPASLRLAGLPRSGSVLDLTLKGSETYAQFAAALHLGNWATPFGTSQLDPSALLGTSRRVPLVGGMAAQQLTIPAAPALIGSALHFQAALFSPSLGSGLLSQRISVRVLP